MASIQKLKLLVNLARADGALTEKERQLIINIGQANHMLVAEILPLFQGDHPTVVPGSLSDEQKFNYIFELVQLMKIDERLYKEEIQYCAKVVSILGYRQEVLVDLMLSVKGPTLEKGEMDALKKLTATFLLKK